MNQPLEAVAATPETAQATGTPAVRSGLPLFCAVAAATALLDQLAKLLVRSLLPPGGEIGLLPGLLHLTHTANTGAAWSMLAGRRSLLIAVSILVSILIYRMALDWSRAMMQIGTSVAAMKAIGVFK